jgi:hypothetical protein
MMVSRLDTRYTANKPFALPGLLPAELEQLQPRGDLPRPDTPLAQSLLQGARGRITVGERLTPEQRALGPVMEGDFPDEQPGQPGQPAQTTAASPDFYLEQDQTRRLNTQLRPYNAQLQTIDNQADEMRQAAKEARTKAENRADAEYTKSKKDTEARQKDYDSAVQKAEYTYNDEIDKINTNVKISSKAPKAEIDSIAAQFVVQAAHEKGILDSYQFQINEASDAARRFELQKEQRQRLKLDYPIEPPPELFAQNRQKLLEDKTRELNSIQQVKARGWSINKRGKWTRYPGRTALNVETKKGERPATEQDMTDLEALNYREAILRQEIDELITPEEREQILGPTRITDAVKRRRYGTRPYVMPGMPFIYPAPESRPTPSVSRPVVPRGLGSIWHKLSPENKESARQAVARGIPATEIVKRYKGSK